MSQFLYAIVNRSGDREEGDDFRSYDAALRHLDSCHRLTDLGTRLFVVPVANTIPGFIGSDNGNV